MSDEITRLHPNDAAIAAVEKDTGELMAKHGATFLRMEFVLPDGSSWVIRKEKHS